MWTSKQLDAMVHEITRVLGGTDRASSLAGAVKGIIWAQKYPEWAASLAEAVTVSVGPLDAVNSVSWRQHFEKELDKLVERWPVDAAEDYMAPRPERKHNVTIIDLSDAPPEVREALKLLGIDGIEVVEHDHSDD